MNKTDKKVKKYLERARDILLNFNFDIFTKKNLKNVLNMEIEIAKMIQKEEHFDPWEDK